MISSLLVIGKVPVRFTATSKNLQLAHDVEGNRIADFLDSLTLDDTNPHVFSTTLSNGITLSIGLVSTVDANSAAYNDSRVIFDVRFFEVAETLDFLRLL